MNTYRILSATLYSSLMVASLLACTPTPSEKLHIQDDNMQAKSDSPLAKIYEATISDGSVRFSTISNGCTSASNFALSVNYNTDANKAITELSIHLLKPDYCKAMPRIVTIDLPIDFDITGALKILNPELERPDLKSRRRSVRT